MMLLAMILNGIVGFTGAQALELEIAFQGSVPGAAQEKILRIRDRVETITITDAFRKEALSYSNYSCLGSGNLPDGVSSVSEAVDFVQVASVSIEISFFYEDSRTRAVTSSKGISFNTYFFESDEEEDIANTLLHETLHVAGFGHCGKNNTRWYPKILRSIPYRFGDVVESLY